MWTFKVGGKHFQIVILYRELCIYSDSGNGIFVPKNTNFSTEETVLQNSAAEFDGENLVYDFATPHSNNREWVVSNGIGNIWIYKERWYGQLKLVFCLF